MSDYADVVVIGGGVIGASVTCYLAEKGLNVFLVDRGGLASGTSGACQGGVLAHIRKPPLLSYVLESQKLYFHAKNQGLDFEYDPCGSFICFDREDQRSMVEEHAKQLKRHGLKISLLERDDLKAITPAIGDEVLGASVYNEDFIVNPIRVAHEFAFAAKELGAKIHVFREVKAIEMKGSEIYAIITDKGRIRTGCVVNAAGVWSPDVAQMIGYTLPVKPKRGQLLVTEPVRRSKIRFILDGDYLVTAYDPDAVEASNDPRIKLGVASSLAQAKTGNWLLGSSRDLAGFDRSCTRETLEWIVKRAMTFLPGLGKLNCIRTFAGLRPITDDGLPVLGRVEEVEDFVIATGTHGEGIMLAPLWGKLTAELIAKNTTSMPIELFNPARFRRTQ
ncbi:MAG: NAD(P)/FAD-dependent oxidoreductase [Candidatus Hodarchaeota archaeon]